MVSPRRQAFSLVIESKIQHSFCAEVPIKKLYTSRAAVDTNRKTMRKMDEKSEKRGGMGEVDALFGRFWEMSPARPPWGSL